MFSEVPDLPDIFSFDTEPDEIEVTFSVDTTQELEIEAEPTFPPIVPPATMATPGTTLPPAAPPNPAPNPASGAVPAAVPAPQAAAPTAAPASAPTSPFKPTKPLMGDVVELDPDHPVAWTGGVPKVDWTGLEDPATVSQQLVPTQYRPHSAKARAVTYQQRITGLTTQLTDVTQLLTFTRAVRTHLSVYGLDTIAYLPDPSDSSRMTNILVEHAKFSVSTCETAMATQLQRYDSYDQANDLAATQFLLSSLSDQVHLHLHPRLTMDRDRCTDPFPVVWCRLMQELQPTSFSMFQTVKDTIKALHPAQFPGEDLKSMMYSFRTLAEELTSAGHYDHDLSLSILDSALLAGGDSNPKSMLRFHTPLVILRERLESELLVTRLMSPAKADTYLHTKSLSYKHIADSVSDRYMLMKAHNQWPPALLIKDKATPPATYISSASDALQSLLNSVGSERVAALLQQHSDSGSNNHNQRMTPQNSPCSNCGEIGHWRRD